MTAFFTLLLASFPPVQLAPHFLPPFALLKQHLTPPWLSPTAPQPGPDHMGGAFGIDDATTLSSPSIIRELMTLKLK